MKDVGACEKSRGAGKHAMIRECPNGETQCVATHYPFEGANSGN